MGVNEEHNPITIMPYKVNKSFNDSYERQKSDDPNNLYSLKCDYIDQNTNNNSDNFEDVMKKTIAEINKDQEQNLQFNEITKKEEENDYCRFLKHV